MSPFWFLIYNPLGMSGAVVNTIYGGGFDAIDYAVAGPVAQGYAVAGPVAYDYAVAGPVVQGAVK